MEELVASHSLLIQKLIATKDLETKQEYLRESKESGIRRRYRLPSRKASS